MTSAIRERIDQTAAAYTLSGGVANVEVAGVKRIGESQVKVIHVVPLMTDTERDAAKKRIGSDLYEIFMRIQEELNLDNEFAEK